ncbi:site-2 protease family protein [Virgibacillus sp. 179-BFC.A HS]|uniref:Site-2 protease family protein n=1 Tax=Tigheibacillus jepli TaxID=3035914 RepID=A0ABU5CH67_9BACI|nr:site-2 protease family protein [Virgibacillus sp. 179-BFC.A HS]MDY0405663.1 site-2 protease family protein [Virgibacillus sp. 179-BFC.A HS]
MYDLIKYLIDIAYLVLLVGPVSIFLHECGHMLGAVMEKAYPIIMHIGRGKKRFHLHIKHLDLFIYSWYFLGGMTDMTRTIPYSTKKMIFTTLSGPLCSLIIAVFFLLLFEFTLSRYALLWGLFNGWLGLSNLIPYKLGKKCSDGYIIWQAAVANRK